MHACMHTCMHTCMHACMHDAEVICCAHTCAFRWSSVRFNAGARAQRHFSTDEYVYFKSERTSQLDEELGDISSKISDREFAILDEVRVYCPHEALAHARARALSLSLSLPLSFCFHLSLSLFVCPRVSTEVRVCCVPLRS